MQHLFALSGLINAAVALSLAFFIVLRGLNEHANRIFLGMLIAFAMWSLGYWFWLESTTAEHAIFWLRVLSFGSIFIPVFHFHWVSTLTGNQERLKHVRRLAYVVGTFLAVFSFSSLIVASVRPVLIFTAWPLPGPFYHLYVATYAYLICYSIVLLLRAIRTADVQRAGQYRYILLGTLFGFVGGATNFLLWYGIPILPFGNFLVAFFPFLLGYAVLRHGLFSSKTVATEIFVFALCMFILVRAITASTFVDLVAESSLFILTIFVGTLLIRSVYREVETRERIEALAKDLELANARLKELDLQKSEFVSIASHQLRSPLTAIKGYVSMLLEDTPSYGNVHQGVITAAGIEALSRVMKSANNLVAIIEDLLNISRIEQGRMQYTMTPFDVGAMAHELVENLAINARERGLTISFQAVTPVAYTITGDVGKIRQVINNVIDNSIKYTPHGSIMVTVGGTETGATRISVKDTGIGISQENIGKLFQKFGRAEGAGKVNVTGTGIGLFIAQEIMKAHHGRIWVESEGEGKGSTFFIEFPDKVSTKHEIRNTKQ